MVWNPTHRAQGGGSHLHGTGHEGGCGLAGGTQPALHKPKEWGNHNTGHAGGGEKWAQIILSLLLNSHPSLTLNHKGYNNMLK